MNKCVGCGITLQNKDKDALGYTNNLDNLYCERCFKTIHYNIEHKIDNLDNLNIIDKINKKGIFTFFITDLINLNKDIIKIFKSINNEKILIINKCDIIPDNLKLEHIALNIKNSYELQEDVLFISAKQKYNLGSIIKIIEDKKKVIFCGETSSGKSTLINNLIGSNLTISKYDNTTLDFIKLKYLDNIIYDSPGLFLKNNSIELNKIIISPKQINNNFIYNIDDLYIKGNGNITFFINGNYKINSKKDNEEKEYITIDDNKDLVIPGVGFIFVKNKASIWLSKDIEIRKSIIGR